MGDQLPLRIISLDGGVVRGISLLYILKALMDQIKLKLVHKFRPLELIPPVRPMTFLI